MEIPEREKTDILIDTVWFSSSKCGKDDSETIYSLFQTD